MVLKKKTSAAPRAVTNQVNKVAIKACKTGSSSANQLNMVFISPADF
jgi:hypothetical protein